MEQKITSFIVAAALAAASLAPSQAASVLHSFIGGNDDGAAPFGSLTLFDSKLYGTTAHGGDGADNGTIFSIGTDGSGYELLRHFHYSDGRHPLGSLTLSGSTFYGMTNGGGTSGYGTIFSMSIDGSGFNLLHSFSNLVTEDIPQGSLTLIGSKLYGVAANGGGGSQSGAIFSINTDGSGFSFLHSFTPENGDGYLPQGSLRLAGSKLYGMTQRGVNNQGTIFSINVDGSDYSIVHTFTGSSADGDRPTGSLTLSGSKLYGMTANGGTSHFGTIFSMNLDGSGFSLLHSFAAITPPANDGGYPVGSLTLFGTTLYGMTNNGGSSGSGTLFSINTDGSGFRVLQSFAGGRNDGAFPVSDVTLSGDGSVLYAMTSSGGTANRGVVFSTPTPEPSTCALLALGLALLRSVRREARASRKT